MNLLVLTDLANRHQPKISELMAACARHEPITADYPETDVLRHYLLFEDTRALIGVLAAIPSPDDDRSLECLAYIRPDMRRRGCFTYLLDACIQDYPDLDVIFPVSHNSRDALAAMEALDADCLSTEFLMERPIDPRDADLPPLLNQGLALTTSDDTTWILTAADGTTIGRCRISDSGSCCCLHDVEICEDSRGKGYAADMMSLLCSQLSARGIKSVFLHVSGGNYAALALYKKTGFRITETMSYYLY